MTHPLQHPHTTPLTPEQIGWVLEAVVNSWRARVGPMPRGFVPDMREFVRVHGPRVFEAVDAVAAQRLRTQRERAAAMFRALDEPVPEWCR